jgi:hypothetical protein
MAFGDTKEVASMAVRPVFDNLFTSSIFSCVSIKFFSFYNPSLGLTSTILIFLGLTLNSLSYLEEKRLNFSRYSGNLARVAKISFTITLEFLFGSNYEERFS